MDISSLEEILAGEPKFRIRQAKEAIFKDLSEDWNTVFTFPLVLRAKLTEQCPLLINASVLTSSDGQTIKALITLHDGLAIETVLMRHEDGRNTVCVSSQVGCALGCKFCATGAMGFKRNLKMSEIIEQVIFFARLLKKENKKVTNVVVMGMGEPFLNYDNVLSAIKVLNDHEGFNLGARNFSISSCGIVEGINKLSEEPLQINLAISLHAPDTELRSKIMPINEKYPLADVLQAVENYVRKTNRKVMFEYLLLDGLNDSENCARKLVSLMKRPLYLVNLVSYNQTGNFKPSPQSVTNNFKKILDQNGVNVTQRFSFGSDIKAACGQLATES